MDEDVKLGKVHEPVVMPPLTVRGDEQGVKVAEEIARPVGKGAVDDDRNRIVRSGEIA